MPPIDDKKAFINKTIKEHNAVIFSKTFCPFCKEAKSIFKQYIDNAHVIELDLLEDGPDIQKALLELTGQKTVPNCFIKGEHIGGCDSVKKLKASGELKVKLGCNYDYDLVVIGGGSGGLSASKEAARLGAKVAVLDYVVPTPLGTKWGLGGTCVNVGCIPKKLMHQAALLRHAISHAKEYGWKVPDDLNHEWSKMVENIVNHIRSLNFGYRVSLRENGVTYKNALGSFVDNHTLELKTQSDVVERITSNNFILATGERPRYPGIPGDKEYGITSDDLFYLSYCPGKTLVVGASYVALECAGFLTSLGLNVTVMVRSILLRGFDQQMAHEYVGNYMESHDTNFIHGCVPTKVEKLEDGKPGLYRVEAKYTDGTLFADNFNTIIFAIGRDACTKNIGLDKVGVSLDKEGRVICNDADQSNVPHIYAIGDIVATKPKLTPVAIQAGLLLARRLYGGSSELMDYVNVPTTVFTPLEYGCIGYSEEDAIQKFGDENIEVYHTNFQPLEWTVPHHEENQCYCKLICLKTENYRVVGFHYCGPNAGEVTQGFTLGMRLGATFKDFENTVGIHPTCAEVFTTLKVSKRSGASAAAAGC